MFNYFLLAGLTLFVACTKGHKEMELESQADEEAKISLLQEEKKIIQSASNQRFDLINKIQEDSSFANKISLSQKYLSQLPIELNTKNRSERLNRADSLHDLVSSLELITRDVKMKKLSPLKMKSEDEKAFFALAASIHYSKNDSLLNIIKSSFNPESSSELNLSDDSLELLLGLMKARIDILSALSLQEIEDAGFNISKTSKKFLTGIKSENEEISLDLESALQSALETKRFLKSVGVIYKIDSKIKSQLKKVKLDKKLKLNDEEKTRVEEIKEIVEELIK